MRAFALSLFSYLNDASVVLAADVRRVLQVASSAVVDSVLEEEANSHEAALTTVAALLLLCVLDDNSEVAAGEVEIVALRFGASLDWVSAVVALERAA